MSNIRNLESSIHFNRVLFVVFRDPRFLCLYRPPVGDIYVQKVPYLSWSTVSTVFVGFWGALLGRRSVGSEPPAPLRSGGPRPLGGWGVGAGGRYGARVSAEVGFAKIGPRGLIIHPAE